MLRSFADIDTHIGALVELTKWGTGVTGVRPCGWGYMAELEAKEDITLEALLVEIEKHEKHLAHINASVGAVHAHTG